MAWGVMQNGETLYSTLTTRPFGDKFMKPNKLREKLSRGEPTLGTQIYSTWPAAVEALGHTGLYDYVEFVSEHGSFDLHDLDNLARTTELYGMGAMIKIDQAHQAFLAQRSVGAGFGAVLFTDCRSADDVRECIRNVRPDTPEDGGLYGSAIRRIAIPDHPGTAEYLQAIRDTVVAVMIEKKDAVDHLDEILSVPGIDMIQWGGVDYSINVGIPRQSSPNPEIQATRNRVFAAAIKAGIPPRAEIDTADEAKEFLDMGVRHFTVGADLHILHNFWNDSGEQLKELLSGI